MNWQEIEFTFDALFPLVIRGEVLLRVGFRLEADPRDSGVFAGDTGAERIGEVTAAIVLAFASTERNI